MEPGHMSISSTMAPDVSNPGATGNGAGSWSARWFGCSNLTLFLYAAFCLTLTIAGYLRPLPTFDRYLYAGAIASFRYSDPQTVHRIARAEFDTQPSPYQFENVAAEPYFADVRDNTAHFMEQLSFYRVKLAYITLGYAIWRAGLPILTGLRLISAVCTFILALLILAWSHDPFLSLLLLLVPPVLNLDRSVTPDALSAAIILLAFFSLAKRRHWLAICLFGGSVLVRFDAIVVLWIILAWLALKGRIRPLQGLSVGAFALACVTLVNHLCGYYGWRVLMQHSFIKPEIEPLTHPVLINPRGYLLAIASLRVIPYTFMTIWLLVAVAVWKRLPPQSEFRDFLPLAGLCILARLAIYPNFEDRYFAWAYLLAGVALIQMAQSRFANREPARQ